MVVFMRSQNGQLSISKNRKMPFLPCFLASCRSARRSPNLGWKKWLAGSRVSAQAGAASINRNAMSSWRMMLPRIGISLYWLKREGGRNVPDFGKGHLFGLAEAVLLAM